MRVHAIDGLRAIAMTMVVAQHCGLMPFGWTGVWLFFVISGYVITQGFVSRAYQRGSLASSYWHFMGRRTIRIVPVYLLYLAVCAGVLVAIGEIGNFSDVPYLLSFSYNWHMLFQFWPKLADFGPFGHLWTLSVEQQFYLVFGVFALALPVRAQLFASLALIAAGPLFRWGWSSLWQAELQTDPLRHAFFVYAATPCHIDAFLLGSLIARLEPQLRARPRAVTAGSILALSFAALYAVVYVGINRGLGASGGQALRNVYSGILYGQGREVFVYLAVDLLAAVALIHVLLGRVGSTWLAARPLAWVGRVSYGGYLFHALVLWLVARYVTGDAVKDLPIAQRVLAFAALWSVTVALASASFRWFELPLARRWSHSKPRVSEPSVDSLQQPAALQNLRS